MGRATRREPVARVPIEQEIRSPEVTKRDMIQKIARRAAGLRRIPRQPHPPPAPSLEG